MQEFRVWCKNNNEWEKDICFLGQDGILFHMNRGSQTIALRRDSHDVEFYIGREDKNGRKIFVGDIIDLHSTVNGVRYFEVVYDQDRLGFGIRYYTDRMNHRSKKYEYSVEDFFSDYEHGEVEYEVIGNIHENKELLGE